MTNNIAKIRAALESALARATSGSRVAELRDAIAALAELEKAAAEPVAWRLPTTPKQQYYSVGPWEYRTNPPGRKEAQPLYTTPPVPVAEIREVVVTDGMCERVAASFYGVATFANSADMREALQLWQKELGPVLGLVEIREPTVGECERIDSMYASLDRTSHGRAMFDAVRAVMWPKSEAK